MVTPTPKATPSLWSRVQHAGLRGVLLQRAVIIALIALLAWMVLYPILALVARSFTVEDVTGWTLAAYETVYASGRTWEAARNTVIIVVMSTMLSVTVGVSLAWLLRCTDVWGAKYLNLVPFIPLLLPPLLGAAGWIFLLAPGVGFLNVGIRALLGSAESSGPFTIYSVWGMAWVTGLYCVPYVYSVVDPALQKMDASLDEAAALSGAGTFTRLRTVVLPVIAPAIAGGAFFSVIVSASEFTVPALIGSGARVETISTLIYTWVNQFPVQFSAGAALSMMLLLFVSLAAIYQRRLVSRGIYTTVGGKASIPSKTRLGRWRPVAFAGIIAYIAVAILLPLAAIIFVSISPYWSVTLTPEQLTLNHFRFILFEHSTTFRTIMNSTVLAFAGATASVALGVAVVYITLTWKSRMSSLLDLLATIPLGIPAIVFGAGALFAFIRPPIVLYGTLAALLVAYVAHILPIASRPILTTYVQLNRELIEASWVGGGREMTTVLNVVLPLIRSGIFSGWALTFILLLREMPMSVMLSTPNTSVISVELFSFWDGRTIPVVAAFSLVVFVLGLVGLLVIALLAQLLRTRLDVQSPTTYS